MISSAHCALEFAESVGVLRFINVPKLVVLGTGRVLIMSNRPKSKPISSLTSLLFLCQSSADKLCLMMDSYIEPSCYEKLSERSTP